MRFIYAVQCCFFSSPSFWSSNISACLAGSGPSGCRDASRASWEQFNQRENRRMRNWKINPDFDSPQPWRPTAPPPPSWSDLEEGWSRSSRCLEAPLWRSREFQPRAAFFSLHFYWNEKYSNHLCVIIARSARNVKDGSCTAYCVPPARSYCPATFVI